MRVRGAGGGGGRRPPAADRTAAIRTSRKSMAVSWRSGWVAGRAERSKCLEPQGFAGSYRDATGTEQVQWRIEGSRRYGYPQLEVSTTIRGVPVSGTDFDGLEPVQTADPRAGALALNTAGEVGDCVLTGDLPCAVVVAGQRREVAIHFVLDLRADPARNAARPGNLRLSARIDSATFKVTDDWFEDGVLRLADMLPPDARLMCCATCLYSDYSPGGHGLMGMRCHRNAEQQYLAVRSKADYWSVPVTEEVPETYLCPEYQRRIPGTGYRG